MGCNSDEIRQDSASLSQGGTETDSASNSASDTESASQPTDGQSASETQSGSNSESNSATEGSASNTNTDTNTNTNTNTEGNSNTASETDSATATDTDSGVSATVPDTDSASNSATETDTASSVSNSNSATETDTAGGATETDPGGTNTMSGTDTGPMCAAPNPDDECQTCVYETCGEGAYCECAGDKDCLCVLDCLQSNEGAIGLMTCAVGSCGLQGLNLNNLANVLGNSLGGLVDCNSLTNDGPDGCGVVCPAAEVILF